MKFLPSGKFVIRLSSKLHFELKEESKQAGLSLNEYCVSILKSRKENSVESFNNKIVTDLVSIYGDKILGIILFGSQARGDAHDDSDFDILVVMNNEVLITRELYRSLPECFDQTISIHFAHINDQPSEASSLFLECAIDGKILYDSKNIISTQIEKIRNFIFSGNVKRLVTHGQGFWVRQ